VWYSLVGLTPDSLALNYRITTGVVPGRYYRFRVRARNAFGWGDLSPWIEIKAATLPDTMVAPTTTIDEATGHLRISWIAPHDGSDTITKYTIKILDRDQTSSYDIPECDGN